MRFIAAAILATALPAAPALASSDSLNELRINLQTSLQRQIDRSLIDGALPHLDLETGEVTNYYPTENHPMIVELGDLHVMCADLRTADGQNVPVDYYMARSGKRFTVIRTEINNRAPLRALMKAGQAQRLK